MKAAFRNQKEGVQDKTARVARRTFPSVSRLEQRRLAQSAALLPFLTLLVPSP